MAELYGASFVSAYGEKPSPLWQAAIGELSDSECKDGLTRLAKQPRSYPANLTEFVAACRPVKQVRYLGSPTTPGDLRRLEPPGALSGEEAAKRIAAIRNRHGFW